MKDEKDGTCTIRLTWTQGSVLAIVAEVLRIGAACPMSTHVQLSVVDMKTDKSTEADTPSVDEGDSVGKNAEVLTVTLRSSYRMYGIDWDNAISGIVEAKLRLFRENRSVRWKLHYVMVILPDLAGGKKPNMYVVREFTNADHYRALIQDPGTFYSERANSEAVDRSSNAPDLLRLSQLILNDEVAPWEGWGPKEEPASVKKPHWLKRRFSWLCRW